MGIKQRLWAQPCPSEPLHAIPGTQKRTEMMLLQKGTKSSLWRYIQVRLDPWHRSWSKTKQVSKANALTLVWHEDQVVIPLLEILQKVDKEKLILIISRCFANPDGITQDTSMRISVSPCTCVYYFFSLPAFIGFNT